MPFSIVVALLLSPAAARPLTTPCRFEREQLADRVRHLVEAGTYAEVNALVLGFVAKDERSSCGTEKLVDVYEGLDFYAAPEGTPLAASERASFEKWMRVEPRSYLARYGLSALAQSRAWQARGTGLADSVEPQQWKAFRRHLDVAWSWAEKALAQQPRDPEFYSRLIDLCMASGCPRSEAEKWLARALEIKPGYENAYVSMANYVQPRWYGHSGDDLAEFAQRSAEAEKSSGNAIYARIATVALLNERMGIARTYPRLDWHRIQEGFREIDQRFPNSDRTYHLLAEFAVAYHDKPVARTAFRKLRGGWGPDAEDYWESQQAYSGAVTWAFSAH
jgi:tetratricopeptide (TPR) repeat protein